MQELRKGDKIYAILYYKEKRKDTDKSKVLKEDLTSAKFDFISSPFSLERLFVLSGMNYIIF